LDRIYDIVSADSDNYPQFSFIVWTDIKYIIQAETEKDKIDWMSAIKRYKNDRGTIGYLTYPDKQGFLTKRGHIVTNWKLRFFVLKDENMYYFKTPNDSIHIGVIPLVNAILEETDKFGPNGFSLQITDPISFSSKSYFLLAETKQQVTDWLTAIGQNITIAKKQHTSREDAYYKNIPRTTLLTNPESRVKKHVVYPIILSQSVLQV